MPDNLHKEFLELLDRGDEKAAKEFLVTHLKEFSQKTQDMIITAFLEEALGKANEEASLISFFQKRGIEAVEAIEKSKKELEDKQALLKLKEKI